MNPNKNSREESNNFICTLFIFILISGLIIFCIHLSFNELRGEDYAVRSAILETLGFNSIE